MGNCAEQRSSCPLFHSPDSHPCQLAERTAPNILQKQICTILGFSLDNPRSKYEVSVVENYLLTTYERGQAFRFPVVSDENIVTIEGFLFDFRDAVSGEDEYVAQVYEAYDREHVFEFLARMWVIARFDDEGIGDQLRGEQQRMREEGIRGVWLLEENNPLVVKTKALADYCSLLSLLIHSEGDDYSGRPLLVDNERVDVDFANENVWRAFFYFGLASLEYPHGRDDPLNWVFFPHVLEELAQVVIQLEEALTDEEDKLLYIGSVLKIAAQPGLDERTRVLLLTSIIELLLTHNPDFNRYNVEDSINKQFQLKASILVYMNDKRRDLKAIRKRLITIYNQRSNIAHGNFEALEKYVRDLGKKEGTEEYFDDLVTDLYLYIRAIIEEYLNDRAFVNFLKSG